MGQPAATCGYALPGHLQGRLYLPTALAVVILPSGARLRPCPLSRALYPQAHGAHDRQGLAGISVAQGVLSPRSTRYRSGPSARTCGRPRPVIVCQGQPGVKLGQRPIGGFLDATARKDVWIVEPLVFLHRRYFSRCPSLGLQGSPETQGRHIRAVVSGFQRQSSNSENDS